jgi:hypothetical protein
MEGESGQTIGEIEQLFADPIMREAGVPRGEQELLRAGPTAANSAQ